MEIPKKVVKKTAKKISATWLSLYFILAVDTSSPLKAISFLSLTNSLIVSSFILFVSNKYLRLALSTISYTTSSIN